MTPTNVATTGPADRQRPVNRMPLDGATTVKNFVKSGAKDQIIAIKLGVGRAYRKLKELELQPQLHKEFTVRLVRLEREDGEVEVLMTSLTDRRALS